MPLDVILSPKTRVTIREKVRLQILSTGVVSGGLWDVSENARIDVCGGGVYNRRFQPESLSLHPAAGGVFVDGPNCEMHWKADRLTCATEGMHSCEPLVADNGGSLLWEDPVTYRGDEGPGSSPISLRLSRGSELLLWGEPEQAEEGDGAEGSSLVSLPLLEVNNSRIRVDEGWELLWRSSALARTPRSQAGEVGQRMQTAAAALAQGWQGSCLWSH